MTTTTDSRGMAAARLAELIAALKGVSAESSRPLIEECEALARAIAAFHMEGIRFRIFNVDRLMSRAQAFLPPQAPGLLEDVRRHLEDAGFHTRSHQAPG